MLEQRRNEIQRAKNRCVNSNKLWNYEKKKSTNRNVNMTELMAKFPCQLNLIIMLTVRDSNWANKFI